MLIGLVGQKSSNANELFGVASNDVLMAGKNSFVENEAGFAVRRF